MVRFMILLLAAILPATIKGDTFRYSFSGTSLADALSQISGDHPSAEISFIYNELENYRTSSVVNSDNILDALRQTVGLNPVTVSQKRGRCYVEALQRGKYRCEGKAVGRDNEPVVAATVMMLSPEDSTVLTYGITGRDGAFSITCDRKEFLLKLSSIGYRTTYRRCQDPAVGKVTMDFQTVNLKGIKVETENARIETDKTIFVPTPRQKSHSGDAVTLLMGMAIPQINVNAFDGKITTLAGKSVAVFIDYVEADSEDLKGLLPKDVKRVEYYRYPLDPRFKGEDNVINFVMQKYEWGGYTRLSADKWFSVERTEGSVYSKMAYKNMTFDFYADEIYFTDSHSGSEMTERFRFTDLYGKGPAEVERKSFTSGSRLDENINNVTLRAVYGSESSQFSNKVGFAIDKTPHSDIDNMVEYSSENFHGGETFFDSSSKDMALSYAGDYYHSFNDRMSLQADASYIYGHNRRNSVFSGGGISSIVNDATEHTHRISVSPGFIWQINPKHSVTISANGRWSRNDIRYAGNSPSVQRYDMGVWIAGGRYVFASGKWRIGAEISYAWENNSISGVENKSAFPLYEIYASYTFNERNQISGYWNVGRDVPEAYSKSPTMLQQDELMWFTGNPSLRDYRNQHGNITYTWIPGNRFSMSGDAYYYLTNDRSTQLYAPFGPDGTMLRKYVNDGSYLSGMLGINANASFFDGSLMLRARPQFWMRRTTGNYAMSNNEMTLTLQAMGYLGDFTLSAFYQTPSCYVQEESGIKERTASRYMLTASWNKNGWSLNATAYNFLNYGWGGMTRTLESEYYGFKKKVFGTDLHARFSVSVSYTFNYGKKVNRSSEVSGAGTSGSAILK